MAELNWSDAQWQKVKEAVNDAFVKTNVSSTFLKGYRTVAGSTETVRNERLIQDITTVPPTTRLDSDHDAVNLKLVNLTVNVELPNEKVSDDTLSDAIFAFQDAANTLALEQDRVVFAGYGRGFPPENSSYVVNQVQPQRGLADLPTRFAFAAVQAAPPAVTVGQAVVTQVVAAIGRLEASSKGGPFACVLGDHLFNDVNIPSPALVMPVKSIVEVLKGGSLLRSGMMDPDTGIVVSLGSNAVDVVVGAPPTAQFLQRQPDARFLFRVYERFVLRIRDDVRPPVAGFRIRPDVNGINNEAAWIALLGF